MPRQDYVKSRNLLFSRVAIVLDISADRVSMDRHSVYRLLVDISDKGMSQ